MTAPKVNPYTERDARAAELRWTWLSDDRCPRRLVGKRHRERDCWCNDHLNDHAATWRDNEANRHQRFVLWEPYGAHGEALTEVIAAAREDGIRVHIDASVWNPDGRGTVGIRFTAAPLDDEADG